MEANFKFIPLDFSWVALHPQPIGVVQVIGGAFFGTFPTIFYRYLCQQIFNQGYTIVAIPYRFTFRHWSVSIGLVRDLVNLRIMMLEEAKRRGYEYQIYQEKPTDPKGNYYWLGHSLGSKYIALLELLTELEFKAIEDVLGDCVGEDQQTEIKQDLQDVDLESISLKNQAILLLAPAITGIEAAIPVKAIADLMKKLGLDVKPNVEQTHCLILRSRLFNLFSLIALAKDNIAKDTVTWIKANLSDRLIQCIELPNRGHLAPLGWKNGDTQLATKVIECLEQFKQKCDQIAEHSTVKTPSTELETNPIKTQS
ncbi:conserved hypothetical protein [Rippkaea orientalis PCC 8801]|uniref:DUF1350 domain-containing protein n=1 Tax=Rippkaea orientalis (strain PCC 8801 / RF-1) TaxID=41431 RepID=B7JYP6_RIPO1|nr:DUF1350 family protein [Rippkaea orientalis]ACK64916.1 conserved hypothetical protein [Rippkaea orientalis PCC 8801]